MRHALTTVLRITIKSGPPAIGHLFESFLEPGRRPNDTIFQFAAFLIADAVQRLQNICRNLPGFLENGTRKVRFKFVVTWRVAG